MNIQTRKTALFFISLGLFTASASISQAKEYKYDIKGMKCGHCVDEIKAKVCTLPGIEKCEVEVGQMKVTLSEKNAPSEKLITKTVKNAGHFKVEKVTEVKTEEKN